MTDRRSDARTLRRTAPCGTPVAPTRADPGAVTWPEVATRSRVVWPLVLWRATSEHPDIGAIRGRGLSRAGALRAATRRVRRAAADASSDRASPDEGIERPPIVADR